MKKKNLFYLSDRKTKFIANFKCGMPDCDFVGRVSFRPKEDIEWLRCPKCINPSLERIKTGVSCES